LGQQRQSFDGLRTGLLNDGVSTYTYDHANRLTQVVNGTLTTQFTYNGVGDRVTKTVDGVTTDYVLDASTGLTTGPAAGLTQVLQDTTAGQTQSYLYGHDGSTGLTTGLLAQYDSGTWAYHVYDGLGSVRHLADPVGQVVGSYSFSPFGVPLGESGGEPYGFTGEWWDADVGLLYLRARWYEPDIGRFTQRDPWEGNHRQPLTVNPYLYVLANPLKWVDPTGFYSSENVFEFGCGTGESCVIHEVVTFIVERMREDATSQETKKIRELNESHLYEDAWEAYEKMTWWQKLLFGNEYLRHALEADMAAHQMALVEFGCLVSDYLLRPVCGQWDYKKEIGDKWRHAQRIDFCSIGLDEEVIFYYDIWANIHFGYVGIAGAFSEDSLRTGAALEHAVRHPGQFQDDPSDQAALGIGVNLSKCALTEKALLRQLYIHRRKLNKAIIEDGIITGVYR
jgi:RHS repeat-associated protein